MEEHSGAMGRSRAGWGWGTQAWGTEEWGTEEWGTEAEKDSVKLPNPVQP